jgi:hypothetical protein
MKLKEYKKKEIVLLNSEGPVLKAKKADAGVVLYNTQDEIVDILSNQEFSDFIYNERPIIFTDGKEMVWSKMPESMKIDKESLEIWMGKKKGSKLVYLASPYSHPDDTVRHENYLIVTKIAADLVSRGHVVISPITYGHVLLDHAKMPSDWEFWNNFCITLLEKCDKILVCNTMFGWDKSRGVAEEIKYAEENGIEIEYLNPKK